MKQIAPILVLPLLAAGFTGASRAEEQANPIPVVVENQWRGSITPYAWLLNVNGTVARDGNTLLRSAWTPARCCRT